MRANSSRTATSASGRLTLIFIPEYYRSATIVSHKLRLLPLGKVGPQVEPSME